jgi:hypothetical protein
MHIDRQASPGPGKSFFGRPAVLIVVYLPPVFLGALLMFWSEMLIGKMVLPLLGGAPMVWTTCMVFFQALLLAGYAYAHWTMRLGPRAQAMLYLAFISLSLPFLPVGAEATRLPPVDADPRPWLIGWLAIAIGAPFLVLAAAAPMLQAWFARTRHPDAADPYFLYVASNAGSLIGLLAFPALAEPQLTLMQQSGAWSWTYAAFAGLIVLAALMAPAAKAAVAPPLRADRAATSPAAARPTAKDRARWVLLAFAPSSLFLGLTSLIATDIAAVPLIWMLPLAAYLITFMIAFARRPLIPHWAALVLQPTTVLPPLFIWFWDLGAPTFLTLVLHFAGFFFTALVCHGELARTRPAAAHLTDFYLCLSLGGALGGVFNSLVAPLVFTRVFEYPLVMGLALLLRPWAGAGSAEARRLDFLAPACWFGMLLCVLILYREEIIPHETEVIVSLSMLMGLFCIPAQPRTLRFALLAGGLIFANYVVPADKEDVVYTSRNFFGVLRVVDDESDKARYLYHGTTQHGAQHTDHRRLMPITYYPEDGPVGQIFRLPEVNRRDAAIATVGLGTGTIACHANKGQRVTFYEIDPAVKRVATDPSLFTFFRDCPARSAIVLGDGRLMLAEEPAGSFDLIVLDAFSSDAIPVHLLTREAVALYRSRLRPGGMVLIHISNRYLDLTRVLAPLAADAGLAAFVRDYEPPSSEKVSEVLSNAHWVVFVPEGAAKGIIEADTSWSRLEASPDMSVWTDSFSNLLGIIR